jgi:hypothetical protein
MRSYGRIIGIGVLVIAIIGIGVGLYYFLYKRPAETPFLTGQPAVKLGEKALPAKEIPFITLPALNHSDEWLRKKAKDLSNYPKLAEWLKVNDLIRRITAAVDNIAEGDIALKEGVISYYMVDEDLEGLSDAQKHLLRMGPQNIRKIQNKLREMAVALGVPENQLPNPQGRAK